MSDEIRRFYTNSNSSIPKENYERIFGKKYKCEICEDKLKIHKDISKNYIETCECCKPNGVNDPNKFDTAKK